jgi:hypothetical protein
MMPMPMALKQEVLAAPLPPRMNKISLADIEAKKKQRRVATANAIRRDYSEGAK